LVPHDLADPPLLSQVLDDLPYELLGGARLSISGSLQAASSKQQAASSKQQAASSKQQACAFWQSS
jgi:hypothetical protein